MLTPGTFSQPIQQKSRSDKSTVYRLFYLKEKIEGGPPPFNEMEGKIADRLIDEKMGQESGAYMHKLRDHFHVEENEDVEKGDFKPFSLSN